MSNINAHQEVKPQTIEVNSPILIDSAALGKKCSIRILHVDDDPSMQELTKLMLLDLDSSFEIDNACCVDEAFGKLAVGHYDVVVSDYEMPQKDGLQFLTDLRKQNTQIPFVLFTGKGREEVAIKALNLGADAYCNKQGDPETVYGELSHGIKRSVEHQKAKKQLQDQTNLLVKIASQTPGMLFQLMRQPNGTYCIPYTSEAIRNIFGCSPQEVREDFSPIVKVIVPKDMEKVIQSIEYSAKHLTAWQCEYRVQIPGQQIRWLWGQSIPEKLDDGSIVWNGYNTDVTEQKRTAETLADSEAKYRALIENADDAILLTDLRGKNIYRNRAHFKSLGFEEGDEAKIEELMKVHPDDVPLLKKKMSELFQTGYLTSEYRIKNFEGSWAYRHAKSTLIYNIRHQPYAIITIIRDITERKKAEDALSGKEKRFRAIFDKSFQFALILDINGIVLEMNELCYTVHGPLAEGCLGKPFWEAAWWSQFPEVAEKTKLAIQNCQVGKIVHDEVEFIDKDFQIHHGIRIFSPIADENGKLLYISVVGLDISERKKAEEALRKSEEKHRIISGITADVTFSCTKKGEEEFFVDWISGACEKIFGYSAKEIQEKGCWKFAVQPKDLPIFEEKITNLKLGQKSLFELRITNKNGSTRWLKVKSIVEEDSENPGSLRLFGACTDITERKQKEFELQLERDKLETVTENIGAGLFLVDKDYKILWTNKMSKHHFGELESKQCYMAFRNLNDVCPDCGVREIFENGKEIDVREHCFKDTKGDPGWLELTVRPIKDETGKVVAALELAVPITERKEIEEKLLASSLYSRSLLEASLDPLVTISKEGKITDVNKATEDITGWPRETLIGSDFSDYFTEPEHARIGYHKVFTEGLVKDYPLGIRHKSGRISDVLYNAAIYRNANGEIQGVFAAARDITERKKAEEIRKGLESKVKQYSEHLKNMVDLRTAQLKDANERLVKSERLAAIGELAGMIGHDLRNPLAGIKNGVYILKKKGTTISEAQSKETLEIIDKAIDHSNKIINDLLDYSREMNLKLIKYAARPLVDEAIRIIQVPDRIQIVNHVDEEACIWVDADKMIRVFVNLLQNAIDATPENGKLEITSCQQK